jgi:hypothetical protein
MVVAINRKPRSPCPGARSAVISDPEEMALDVFGDVRIVLRDSVKSADVSGPVGVLPQRFYVFIGTAVFAQTPVRPGPFARIERRDVMMLFTFSCRRADNQLGSAELKHSTTSQTGAR